MSPTWNPQAWRQRPIHQAPAYPDAAALADAEQQLQALPPLVLAQEIRTLKSQLAAVARGEAFMLQGGDCAESFAEFSANTIRDTVQTLTAMALVLGKERPVVSVGRIAGQFAKPRSATTETQHGIALPSYRGDIVNGAAFNADARQPDPQRMLRAYQQSAITLNLLRALQQTGYNSSAAVRARHVAMVQQLRESGSDHGLRDIVPGAENQTDHPLYSSHEALLLPYEAALTRRDSGDGNWYDCSAHMLWIGDRTRQLDGAHLAFCSGIANPLGLKCGPSMTPDELLQALDSLDPAREPGRITLIVRMGAERIHTLLPPLIRAVQREGRPVIWSCDPMHGNTVSASSGHKTRPFARVLAEMQGFFEVHRSEGSHAGGLHLEMTGKDVTECTGGVQQLADSDLGLRYHTHCDPRLNASQALEVACAAQAEMQVQPQRAAA